MIKSPFKAEQIRHELALAGKYKELLQTYNKKYPEIKDFNSPSWFERRHRQHLNRKEEKIFDPMEIDRLGKVVDLIYETKEIKVLNIGIGAAELESIYFKTKGSRTYWYGIDIYSSAINNASSKFPRGDFRIGDIRKLPYRKNYFDYICAIEVLEHIRPRDTFNSLSLIHKILNNDGYFILSVPLNEPLEEMISKEQNPNAHVRMYTPELIKAELEIAKFKVVKQNILYAFKRGYHLKKIISYFYNKSWKPNDIIIIAKKA